MLELVEGPTLAERVRDAPVPLPEALAIVRQLALALDAAQRRGAPRFEACQCQGFAIWSCHALGLARLLSQTGEREAAFEALDRAVVERSPMLVLLRVDRAWDRIRDDPRFAVVVRRIGIP